MEASGTYDVSRVIHPDDLMWRSAPQNYYFIGESGLRCVQQALTLAGDPPVHRILDLPCGHGRVARYLRAGFPDAALTFCDLDPSGVDFCARTFQGAGICSKPDLTAVDLGPPHDVIWVGSLFTHVNRMRTAAWLARLVDALAPAGVLVATFHGTAGVRLLETHRLYGVDDASWEKMKAEFCATGYGYGGGEYGMSIAKPSAVVRIAEDIPGCRIVGYHERGWATFHDVLMLSRIDRMNGI
jgi:SAM-dependent methyltransferase